jgi:hypothetical protein
VSKIEKLQRRFSKASKAGATRYLETRYAPLLRYDGDVIQSPSNCVTAFLFISHYMYQRLAIEYPTECGMRGMDTRNIEKKVSGSLTDLLVTLEGEPDDPRKMSKKIRDAKVHPHL